MTGDPYKTLFVARLVSFSDLFLMMSFLSLLLLKIYVVVGIHYPFFQLAQNYETTEHRIKREFESYGPIKRVSVL